MTLLATHFARADIIAMTDIARGIVMTRTQCVAFPQAVWINTLGRNLCMRYYLSTVGGEGSRPVVFLQGDLAFDTDQKTGAWLAPAKAKDTNTDDLVKYADRISKQQKTTGIYLARMGRDGSSGWHRQRHTVLEVQATSAALDAIKQRYGFEGFNVYGHSGGGLLVGGLLASRKDLGCAISADGIMAPGPKPKASDPSLQYFDSVAHISAIVQNRAGRIIVVTDPQDITVRTELQNPFVEKLRKAGGQVEQYFVEATDDEHHFTTPHAALAMSDCLRNAGQDEIAADLAKLDTRLVTAKEKAEENGGATTREATALTVGSVMNGINLYGSDYASLPVQSADPTVCQQACRSDTKCVAWTYVRPGVQGPLAKCWLKNLVPQQSKNDCCTSGVERAQ